MLVKFIHDRKNEWDLFLETCVFAYNTSKHESSLHTPFEQYDRKHSIPPKFGVGVKVLKKDFLRKKRKGGCMDHKWLGPYEVIKDICKGFFSLKSVESGKTIKRIHGAHLKVYRTPPKSPNSSNLLSPFNPNDHLDIPPSPFHLDNNSHISSLNHSSVPTSFDRDNSSKSLSSLGLNNHLDVQDSLLSSEFCQNNTFTVNCNFQLSTPINLLPYFLLSLM